MKFNINILSIFAVFCVLLSACAVSAADHVAADTSNGQYLDASENGQIISHDNSQNEAGHAAGNQDYYLNANEDGHNGTIIPPDINHNEAAMMNATKATNSTNSTIATNATGNATNATVAANATHASAPVHNATGNVTHSHLPVTGNPIVVLLAITAVLAGAGIISRKK